jgi:hypothetical protein
MHVLNALEPGRDGLLVEDTAHADQAAIGDDPGGVAVLDEPDDEPRQVQKQRAHEQQDELRRRRMHAHHLLLALLQLVPGHRGSSFAIGRHRLVVVHNR